MIRYLLLLGALAIFLAGCTQVSLPPSPADWQAQREFSLALDQFTSSNRVDLLQNLYQQDPGSPWGQRAETIIRYAQELDKRKEQLEQLRAEQESLKQEIAGLHQENLQLNEKIEQLKGLLIELENRPQ